MESYLFSVPISLPLCSYLFSLCSDLSFSVSISTSLCSYLFLSLFLSPSLSLFLSLSLSVPISHSLCSYLFLSLFLSLSLSRTSIRIGIETCAASSSAAPAPRSVSESDKHPSHRPGQTTPSESSSESLSESDHHPSHHPSQSRPASPGRNSCLTAGAVIARRLTDGAGNRPGDRVSVTIRVGPNRARRSPGGLAAHSQSQALAESLSCRAGADS